MGSWIPDYQYEVMRWIGEMRGVDYLLLRHLLARNRADVAGEMLSKQNASKASRKWLDHGLIKKETIKGDPWMWLTRKGLREVGLPYPARKPAWFHIDHTRGLTRIRFRLENQYGERLTQVIPERELDRQFSLLPKEQQLAGKKADMLLSIDGSSIALEYERSIMSREDIIKLYEQYGGAWLVGTDQTVSQLQRAIAGYEDYFQVIHEQVFALEVNSSKGEK